MNKEILSVSWDEWRGNGPSADKKPRVGSRSLILFLYLQQGPYVVSEQTARIRRLLWNFAYHLSSLFLATGPKVSGDTQEKPQFRSTTCPRHR